MVLCDRIYIVPYKFHYMVSMEKKREITKLEKPIPVFKRGGPDWQAVELPQAAAAIHLALSDPIRATIFEFLDKGPIRQIDLARLLSEALGRKFDVSSIRHHLTLLKNAGLIAYRKFHGGQTKVKMIYRAIDVEVRTRKRRRPEIEPTTSTKSMDEWLAGFRRAKE
jgi:DNA-binding transcriptional ArsR family regulator